MVIASHVITVTDNHKFNTVPLTLQYNKINQSLLISYLMKLRLNDTIYYCFGLWLVFICPLTGFYFESSEGISHHITWKPNFQLCGCTLLGVGIWIAVDRSFMATITGNPLYAVAAYIIIAGGGIIFIISFVGCCGALAENKLMLLIVSIWITIVLKL